MPVRNRVEVTQQQVRTVLLGPSGPVVQFVTRKTQQVLNRARLYCPVDTGNLRSSIVSAVRVQGDQVVGLVGTPVDYAVPVHEGYRTSRRTVPGRPFLRRAMQETVTSAS
jgi:hypothetical protein